MQISAEMRRRREAGLALTTDLIQRMDEAIRKDGWTYALLAKRSGVNERTIQSWLDESARNRATGPKPLRPRLLPHVAKTLGLALGVARASAFSQRRMDVVDVFLAAAMESLGLDYQDRRNDIMRLVQVLRRDLGLEVFYAGEDRPDPGAFEDEGWALADNCDILDRAKRFVLIYPSPLPGQSKPAASSALIEAGYALARRVPILVFFQQSFDSLPFLLRRLPDVFEGCHLVRYRGVDDLVTAVSERQRSFFVA